MRKIILFALVLITIFGFCSCEQQIAAPAEDTVTELTSDTYVKGSNQLVYIYKNYESGKQELYYLGAIIEGEPFNLINPDKLSDGVYKGTTNLGLNVTIVVTGEDCNKFVNITDSDGNITSTGGLVLQPKTTAGNVHPEHYNTFANTDGDEIRVYYVGPGPQIFFMNILRIEVRKAGSDWVVVDRPTITSDDLYVTTYTDGDETVTFLTPGDVMDIAYSVNGSSMTVLNDLVLLEQADLDYNDPLPGIANKGEAGYYTLRYAEQTVGDKTYQQFVKKYASGMDIYHIAMVIDDVRYDLSHLTVVDNDTVAKKVTISGSLTVGGAVDTYFEQITVDDSINVKLYNTSKVIATINGLSAF